MLIAALLLYEHSQLPPASVTHKLCTWSAEAAQEWRALQHGRVEGTAPEVQPPPGPILDESADLDVDEGQHAQRGEDLEDDRGGAMRRAHQLPQGQAVVLVLHGNLSLKSAEWRVSC